MPDVYISPTGSGTGTGTGWDNAATLDKLNAMIAQAGPGGHVYIRADQGSYSVGNAIQITAGGAAGAAVQIIGVDGAGNAMKAEIVGTRADAWTAGAAGGTDVFRLLEGADNLDFESLAFRNIGNGAFRVGAAISNLTIGDMYADNVQRFFDNLVSTGRIDATINGLNIHDVTVAGYSKGAIRIQYNTSNVVIRDVLGDSEYQDGDNFAIGVAIDGTAHDILLQRVEMSNARDTTNAYLNGDGFTTERGNYNIVYDTIVASGNTDGGLDMKSQATVVRNVISLDNKHNFRLWDFAVQLTNILGGSIDMHGSDAVPGGVAVERGATDTFRDSFFYEVNPAYPVFDLRAGNLTLRLQDVFYAAATLTATIGGSVVQTLASTGLTNYVAGSTSGDMMAGTAGRDILFGDAGDDNLMGGAGNDQLVGADGADLLDGGTGADLMAGGAGNDTYIVDSRDDLVAEAQDEGIDLVLTSLSVYTLRVHVENLRYVGTGDFTGNGNVLANMLTGGGGRDTLTGYDGNDILDGGTGADRMIGGTGNDTYYVDDAGDVVVERAGEGADTVLASIASYALTDQVEGLTYVGSDDFTGTGNALNNTITGGRSADTLSGGAGDDMLDGGAGRDLLIGGTGNDTYITDTPYDVVVEQADEGVDSVRTSFVTATLGDNIENLAFTGTGGFTGIGNALANVIVGGASGDVLIGNDGDDTLNGGAGDDMLVGGVGDDRYVVGEAGDIVVEATGEGRDTVVTTLGAYTLGDNVDNLAFAGTGSFTGTGNALDNAITGGAGDDLLDGGTGADTLSGGAGNDRYMIDDAGDRIVELPGGGIDTVWTSLGIYTLDEAVERAVYTGTGNFAATGNASDNALTGGRGDDVLAGLGGNDLLDGGAGADVLIGGIGDDTYVVSSLDDTIVEQAGEGTDTVRTTLAAYTLADTLENLVAGAPGDFSGNGNASANAILGNVGADTLHGFGGNDRLDGGAGDDTMYGGSGDDTYIVDSVGDRVIEDADAGTDEVLTTLAAYTLGDNVERLVFVGAGDFTARGNAVVNYITGGAGNDRLDGGTGADVLTGGAGDDTYLVDDAGDVVVEQDGQGTDTVLSAIDSYALGTGVERVVYTGAGAFTATGNALDNRMTGGAGNDRLGGGAGNDVLDGGLGDDMLDGGAGDDTYFVDSSNDVLVEADGEGDDTARVTAASYVLAAHVEAMTFVGTGSFAGTGNADANRLTGGTGDDTLVGLDGNDTLVGGAGRDLMVGGTGDDLFDVDDAGDTVVEQSGEGADTVRTTLAAYVLGGNVENLSFAGTGAFTGTGNTLDNVIAGGTGADVLSGNGGNDTLIGGAGADRMIGGTGDDIYSVDNAGDVVVESAGEGLDTVVTTLASYTLGANLENLSYAGSTAFVGTGNAAANTIVGGVGNDTLAGLGGADMIVGGAGIDTANYASSGAAVTIDLAAGSGSGGDAQGDVLSGIENVTGSVFADMLSGSDVANVLNGGRGNDVLYGRGGADSLNGQAGADQMYGGDGNDTYYVDDGGDIVSEAADGGIDTVQVFLSSHTLAANVENLTYAGSAALVGTGNELDNAIIGGTGADTLTGLAGNDTLDGGTGTASDVLDGGDGNDTLDGRGGSDWLYGGTGIDLVSYAGSLAGVTVDLAAGTGSGGDAQGDVLSGIENVTGSRYADILTGDAGVNVINGGYGNDTITGGGGADMLIGSVGDDTYYVSDAGVTIVELAKQGADQIFTALNAFVMPTEVEDMTFTGTGDFVGVGNASANVLHGGTGNDTLIGGVGQDTLIGGAGDDVYDVDNANDIVVEMLGEGNDTVRVNRSNYTLGVNVENLVYTGTYATSATFTGTGNALSNILIGSFQTDYLDGREGADVMIGGAGDDLYYVDNADDVIVEDAGGGNDMVRVSAARYVLAANVERIQQIGNVDLVAYGNELDNIITSNNGNDTIYGGAGNDLIQSGFGNDTMYGGAGNDTYRIESAGDIVVEAPGEGIDLVRVSLGSYVAPDEIENVTFNGIGSFQVFGNALANVLTAGKNADLLDGGAGADTLIGGLGDDTYVVDDLGDAVVEDAGAGSDTIRTGLAAYTLGANVEALTFTGAGAFAGTGNALANTIAGGAGSDLLDGGTGADILVGGAGDDIYLVDDAGDVIVEDADAGNDTVRTTLAAYALGTGVESLVFVGSGDFTATGNASANAIVGGTGNDTLDGGAGADTLTGGAGDDIYSVDDAGDVVMEDAGAGIDAVRSTLAAYTLGANVDRLAFVGTGDFVGTGNALANTIIGGAGNDTLDGAAGADMLVGGTGDDTYVVDDAGDVVVEDAGAGIDTVHTGLAAYTLGAEVEALVATGTGPFAGTGNALANTITGGAGNDTLDGAAGADTLVGGAGNDTYLVDDAGDTIVEGVDGGVDTVRTTLGTYVLGANLDSLVFSGSGDFTGTGNALANAITGGAGNDTLDGAAGADTLVGGTGNDTYLVDDIGDTIVEGVDAGIDTVRTTLAAYTLGANVDSLVFGGTGDFVGIGNALANAITGGAGNDIVDGGAGADTLAGGLGDDIYVVDDAGDLVTEAAGAGRDSVRTTLARYALTTDVEVLAYTGRGDFAGTGNGLANLVTGGIGNDMLDGAAGADTLVGGLGNDVYAIDDAGDTIVEDVDAGMDTVRTTLAAYVLGANLDSLVFAGIGSFTGTGNALANAITGGIGADVLDGGSGNDWLDGGAGADRLVGGTGDDIFVVDAIGDTVVEGVGAGTDTVRTTLGSYTLGANVERLVYTGAAAFTGAGNALDNTITGGDGDDVLSGLVGQDALNGGAGNDTLNGGQGLDVIHGDAGQDTLIGESHLDTLYGDAGDDIVIGDWAAVTASVAPANDQLYGGDGNDMLYGDGITMSGGIAGKDYIYGGAGDDMLFGEADQLSGGTAAADYLSGGDGNDMLYGDGRTAAAGIGGADTLIGGAGNDRMFGGWGNDVFLFDARGSGSDVIGDFGQVAGNRDVVSFAGLKLKFSDLHISYVGGNAVIETPAHDVITLLGVNALTSADFLF